MKKIMIKFVVMVLPMFIYGCAHVSNSSARPDVKVTLNESKKVFLRHAETKKTTDISAEEKVAIELVNLIIQKYEYKNNKTYQNKEDEAVKDARESLIKMGKPAVRPLIKMLNYHVTVVEYGRSYNLYGPRLQAARTLGGIGPEAKMAVDALIKSLDDKANNVREASVRALGKIGPNAKKAVPKIIEGLDSYEKRVAAEALGEIGLASVQAVSALTRMVLTYGAEEASIVALGKMGPEAKPAAAVLRVIAGRLDRYKILKDWVHGQHFSLLAARSLLQIDPNDKTIAKSLVKVLDYNTDYRRNYIISTLMEVGKELEPELRVTLQGKQQGSKAYSALDDILIKIEEKGGRFRIKLAPRETTEKIAQEKTAKEKAISKKAVEELDELF